MERAIPARRAALLMLAGALAGCAPGAERPEPSVARSAAVCPDLFRQFDAIESALSTPTGSRDRLVVLPELVGPAQRLRSAGCITMTADLAGLDTPAAVPFAESGAVVGRVSLHAGVVTNMEDDARVRAWFEAAGVPVRTVGSPALGRRVYLGPFATAGGLEQADLLARQAGFVAPYPVGSW